MKKTKISLILLLCLGLSLQNVSASQYLFYHSKDTFVKNAEIIQYIYIGTNSVKGTDRIRVNSETHYFSYVGITYKVAGKTTTGGIKSNGPNDSTRRERIISTRDEMGIFDQPSEYFYNYRTYPARGVINSPSPIE